MTSSREVLLSKLGFRFGLNGPHAARTMMLDELRLLLSHTGLQAARADYVAAIVDDNVLGKPTRRARELTLRYLAALYSLDGSNPVFRAMRRLWASSEAAQPMLGLAVALARDPLLRATQEFILDQPIGGEVRRESVEQQLALAHPDRFSPASLKSFAQNILGTWTAAGLLSGHRHKVRAKPRVIPESLTLYLFLGYLAGRTGQRLFSSEYMSALCGSPGELVPLAESASHRGLLMFMNAGGLTEVRFPGYLTPEEDQLRLEVSHVV